MKRKWDDDHWKPDPPKRQPLMQRLRAFLRQWLGIDQDIREINKDIIAIMNKQLTLQYGDGELVKVEPVQAHKLTPEDLKDIAKKLYGEDD